MRRTPLLAAAVTAALLVPVAVTESSVSARTTSSEAAIPSPELSTSNRLADRRSLVVGDRFYEMGTEDGGYPAIGFHTRGEMGGFWTPPIKVLDGLWFKAGGTWLKAQRYTSGWGYQRMDLGTHDGVSITRTDFAPDGAASRAGRAAARLDVEAHPAAGGRRALRADEGLPVG